MSRFLAVLALIAAPTLASASPVAPDLSNPNNLSANDYLDDFDATFVSTFTFDFVADDAARDVTAKITFFTADLNGGSSAGFGSFGNFTLSSEALPDQMATVLTNFMETLTFTLAKGQTATFTFDATQNDAKNFDYELLVTSMPVAPIPVPAALPLVLTGLAALGVAGRRRRTA